MENSKQPQKTTDLTSVVSAAIKLPGVKVDRNAFLRDQFKEVPLDDLKIILENGPVQAGYSQADLKRMASRIVKSRSAVSSSASFLAGLPGGIAMAATIPADILQFYAVALRMAQELAYLYGEEDMWCDGTVDAEKVQNQLILYCGVMLGAVGAAEAVRIMSSALAKQALKKLPQMALTKTFYYPVVKSVLKFFGVSVTKSTFAKGISKAIPIVGGVVSGGITLASMLPMGNRLLAALDHAHFNYDEDDLKNDFRVVQEICEKEKAESSQEPPKKDSEPIEVEFQSTPSQSSKDTVVKQLQDAAELHKAGILTDEEFAALKAKLISQL